jgi:hypothetical protein
LDGALQGEYLRLHIDTDSVDLNDPVSFSVELKGKQIGINAGTLFKAVVPLVCAVEQYRSRHRLKVPTTSFGALQNSMKT